MYSSLFDTARRIVGQQINEVFFYLDSSDKDFTEQPSVYGKSLLNGFDLKVNDQFCSIGNRFTNEGYGLTITKGRTFELEFVEEDKKQ
jgi:hypothetical protein